MSLPCHYVGAIIASSTVMVMKPLGGRKSVLIRFQQRAPCGCKRIRFNLHGSPPQSSPNRRSRSKITTDKNLPTQAQIPSENRVTRLYFPLHNVLSMKAGSGDCDIRYYTLRTLGSVFS